MIKPPWKPQVPALFLGSSRTSEAVDYDERGKRMMARALGEREGEEEREALCCEPLARSTVLERSH